MNKSKLTYSFCINKVDKTTTIDTLLNITKRKEHVIYRSSSTQDNINISYVTSKDTNSKENLAIRDRSYALTENKIPYQFEYQEKTGTQFYITAEQFLLTDIFVPETATQPSIPLFYKHKLINYNYLLTDYTNLSLIAYEFVDKNFSKINNNEYYLDQNTGDLYNNIKNYYDSILGEYDITYIKYTVKNTVTSETNVYCELINNQRVYILATWNDIDEYSSLKMYGATYDGIVYRGKTYFIEEVTGTNYFRITLATNQLYAYQETSSSKIYLLKPDVINTDLPWYIRINNGKFLANIRNNSNGDSASFKYYIAEYNNQNFYPYPPYKHHINKECIWLNKNIIKSQIENIYQDDSTFFIDILVYDYEENLKYALTNDSSKIGTYCLDTILYTDDIKSIDCLNGIIELNIDILDTDIIKINCYTEETNFEYTGLDFNPLSNADILKYRTIFYTIPETTGVTSFDKSVHYLLVNEDGLITYSSQADDGLPIHNSTTRLLLEDFDTNGNPKHDLYYDNPSTASGLFYRYGGDYESFIDQFNFIDKYSVESQITYEKLATWSGLIGDNELIANFEDNPHILILGEVAVGPSINSELLSNYDVRMRGGGIKDDLESAAIDLQKEVAFYWDKNSSIPYPSACTLMIEYPRYLLEENGGEWTHDEIKQVIEKHMMFGNYPVARQYGNLDPVVTNINTNYTTNSADITWPKYEASSYNLYYWKIKENQINSITGIEESIAINNTITMSGLNTNTDYLFYIESVDSENTIYKGPIYKFNIKES